MKDKLAHALNKQIVAEFYSGYLYLQMAAWFEENNLKGCANWMRVQAQEESAHALIMFNHMIERGAAVELGKIDAPGRDYKSAADVFARSLKHEQSVTASINDLVDLAMKEKDHAARIMLEWFVTEQVEEEASVQEILEKLKIIGDKPSPALMVLDSTLASRTFTMPSPLTAGN